MNRLVELVREGGKSQSQSHAISFHCDKAGYISVRKALKGALPWPALPRISLLSCLAAYLRDKQRARARFLVDTVARTVINAIVAWKERSQSETLDTFFQMFQNNERLQRSGNAT